MSIEEAAKLLKEWRKKEGLSEKIKYDLIKNGVKNIKNKE